MHRQPVAQLDGDLPQDRLLGLGQDEVVPACQGLDLLGQAFQPRAFHGAAGLPEGSRRIGQKSRFASKACGGALDILRTQPEFRGDAFQRAAEARRGAAQGLLPEAKLVGAIGFLHAIAEVGAGEARGLAECDQGQPAHPLHEAPCRAPRRGIAAFHQQRAVGKRGLALPERSQEFHLMRAGGNVLGGDGMELQAAAAGKPGRHVALAMQVGAPELQDRQRRFEIVEDRKDGIDRGLMRIGHRCRFADAAQQGLEALVDLIDAGEVMQHALVDAQPRGDQSGVFPGSRRCQRRRGREGLRALQWASGRKARRGRSSPRAAGHARGRGAECGELGIHLHACREQEQIPLEDGKAETLGQPVDARRGRELGPAALHLLAGILRRFAAE